MNKNSSRVYRPSSKRVFIVTIPIAALFVMLMSSCTNTRKATYFNGLADSTIYESRPIPESPIQPNDILSISVSSLNPEASKIFNKDTREGDLYQSGYLVNQDSTILFPILGPIKAGGLTKEELKNKITSSLLQKKLLLDPIVNVRFVNFKVTVLGEVNKPSVLSVPNEKISILEAIGQAGDLTVYAKRNNVLVIREVNGRKLANRLNLNSTMLFTSPYYYLKANDVVYVEPNKARIASTSRSQQWLPIIFSFLSFTTIVLDRIFR